MPTGTLTLTDIADLAGVRRPVVSMWRRRSTVKGRSFTFPRAVDTVAGVERFAIDDIRDYLAVTGRGRNAEADLDAPVLAVPEGAPLDDLVALLTLRHLSGDDLVGIDLVDTAEELDVDDFGLVAAVGSVEERLVGYVDELYAASYGPADALDRLSATRAGRGDRRAELTEAGVGALAPVVESLLVHLGEDADLVDGSEGASTAVLQLANHLGRPLRIDGDSDAARAARRIATLRGAVLGPREVGCGLRIDAVSRLGAPAALDRADLMIKELGPADLGLLIGPAAVLTDRIDDRGLLADRDGQLRHGFVRAAVRLPRALHRAAPRQAQSLWLVSSEATDRPVGVADLGDLPARGIDALELATDLVAVAARQPGHHYRYLAPRRRADVVAGASVVARGLRAPDAVAADRPARRVHDLAETISAPVAEVRVDVVPTSDGEPVTVTLAELRRRSDVIVKRGTRVDLAWSDPAGSVEAADVPAWQGVRFDPLDLESRAPRAGRTEPGDVVFTTNPPRAHVDETGGRIVPTPARVIRLRSSAPLGPHAMAAQINDLPATSRDVEAWRFTVSRDPELESRLASLSVVRRDLQERLDGLDELSRLVVAAADSDLTVSVPSTSPTTDQEH